mgnify:CR=1 FL=1
MLEWPRVHTLLRGTLIQLCNTLKPDTYASATCREIRIDVGYLVFRNEAYDFRQIEALGCEMNISVGQSRVFYLTQGEDDDRYFLLAEPMEKIFQLAESKSTVLSAEEEEETTTALSDLFEDTTIAPETSRRTSVEVGSSSRPPPVVQRKVITNKRPIYERTIWKVDRV